MMKRLIGVLMLVILVLGVFATAVTSFWFYLDARPRFLAQLEGSLEGSTAVTTVTPSPIRTPVPAPATRAVVAKIIPVNAVFFLRDMEGKPIMFSGKLPTKLSSPTRPFFFDEKRGAEIKVGLDQPANEALVVQLSSWPDTVTLLSPRREVEGQEYGEIDRLAGNTYIFRSQESVWVFPRDVDLLRVVRDDKYRKEVGQQLYSPLWEALSDNRQNLVVAENFPLQAKDRYNDLTVFQKYVSSGERNIGFLMGLEDAKRHAYYNGQPDGEVLWQGKKWYGWVFPAISGEKGRCGYTHLSLAYNADVGYDTPYQVGAVTFVSINSREGFLPHGTLLLNGVQSDWQTACQKPT